MKQIACLLLLSVGTLSAQSAGAPPVQKSAPRQSINLLTVPLQIGPQAPVANCAIPLRSVPAPSTQNYTIRRVTPPPNIDPKFVVKGEVCPRK